MDNKWSGIDIMAAIGQVLSSYHTISGGGGGSYDVDAQTYFNALTTAGTTPTSQQMTDINTYVLAAKAHSWWTGRKAIYFPVWSSAAANAINLRNPGTYNLTFVASPTHTSNGIAWNGSSQYATTGLTPSVMGQNSISLSYYSQTASTSLGRCAIGASGASSNGAFMLIMGNSTVLHNYRINSSSANTAATASATNAFYTITRSGATTSGFYRNGVIEGSVSATGSATPITFDIYLGARNTSGAAGSFDIRKMSYADIGDGLTGTDEATHYPDIQALHTAFGIQQ